MLGLPDPQPTTRLSRSNAHSATFRFRWRPDTARSSFSEVMPLRASHAPPKTGSNQNATAKNLIHKFLNKKQESLERAPAPLCQRRQGLIPSGFLSQTCAPPTGPFLHWNFLNNQPNTERLSPSGTPPFKSLQIPSTLPTHSKKQ